VPPLTAPSTTSDPAPDAAGEASVPGVPAEAEAAAVVETMVVAITEQVVIEQAEESVTNTATDGPSTRRRVRDLTLPLVLDGEPVADDGPDTYDRVALASAGDVTEAELDELENFGLIKPFYDDGIRAFYDRDALVCVRAAAVLAKHSVQPRT
jgi:hypothetical protein